MYNFQHKSCRLFGNYKTMSGSLGALIVSFAFFATTNIISLPLPIFAANKTGRPEPVKVASGENRKRCFYLIKDARDHIRAVEPEEAMVILKQALALDPGSFEAHCKMADCLFMMKKFNESIEECNKALAIRADYPDAFYRRATAYGGLKNYTAALRDINVAIKGHPEKPNFYLGRAELFHRINNTSSAVADLHTYLALAPSTDKQVPTVHLTAAEYFRQAGNRKAERDELGKFIAIESGNVDAYRLRGDSYVKDGMFAAGAADYQAALRLEPDNEHCRTALSEIKGRTKQSSGRTTK